MYLVCRLLRPPRSTLFPYTTLFRSARRDAPRVARGRPRHRALGHAGAGRAVRGERRDRGPRRVRPHRAALVAAFADGHARVGRPGLDLDRKSTRLNSSHRCISYAVFCAHLDLPSFPTRRSSDLLAAMLLAWLAGVLGIVLWATQAQVGPSAVSAAIAALVACGLIALRSWLRSPTGMLAWDGLGWT